MSNEIKNTVDTILGEENDMKVIIPLKDLVWAIVSFSYLMKNIEEEVFKDYPFYRKDIGIVKSKQLLEQKEYYACRRDELSRLIGQYTDFDTQRIWCEVDGIFVNYSTMR